MSKVTIYTTPTCGYCIMAKQFFQDNKVTYREIDVTKSQESAQEMAEKSGQMGTPVITIEKDGKEYVVVGFNQSQLREYLGIT